MSVQNTTFHYILQLGFIFLYFSLCWTHLQFSVAETIYMCWVLCWSRYVSMDWFAEGRVHVGCPCTSRLWKQASPKVVSAWHQPCQVNNHILSPCWGDINPFWIGFSDNNEVVKIKAQEKLDLVKYSSELFSVKAIVQNVYTTYKR